METLPVKYLNPHKEYAKLPTRGSAQSVGLDLYSVENIHISPGKRAKIRTGIAIALPDNTYGRIAPRSGLAVKFGIDVLAGVIDEDYRGEIIIVLQNHGQQTFQVQNGDKIAQLIVEPFVPVLPMEVGMLSDTLRGDLGFGSTGT